MTQAGASNYENIFNFKLRIRDILEYRESRPLFLN